MNILKKNVFDRCLRTLALLTFTAALSACGGGGGSPGTVPGAATGTGTGTGTGTTTPTTGTIVMSTVDASGAASNQVTVASPLTAKAVLKDKSGKLLVGAVVTFTSDNTLVKLSTTAGTGLTDANGVASITLQPASSAVSGAGTLTATATADTVAVTGSATFVVGSTATTSASLGLTLLNSSGQASTSLSSSTPLTAQALVKDQSGNAIGNALVTFSSDNTLATLSPSAGTALTDSTGLASVLLRPATLAAGGAGTVKASVTVAGATISSAINYTVGSTSLSLSPLSLTPAHIAAYASTVVSVDVLAAGVKYTGQKVTVNFNSASCVASGKATMAAVASTIGGTAQVVYRDNGCGDTDQISASIDNTIASSSASLTIDAPTVASIQFTSALPTNQSIVIAGQGGNGRLETARLNFTVLDNSGNPAPGKTVDFTTASPDVTINTPSAVSGPDGVAFTTVNSGSKPTSFRVLAKLHGSSPAISTLSDSVVVTTGLAVQSAVSISATVANVEGWTYDSGPVTPATNINILLADQFGNPVPDGTPVVFQTNLGAVGSSSKGACNTLNGGCSVDFRTQQPRQSAGNLPATPCNNLAATGGSNDSTRIGVATVCSSTSDGLNTLFAKIALFFSGSVAQNVYLDGSSTPLTGAVVDLGQVGKTESKVIRLLISDVNFNPMPAGTKVEITNVASAAATGVSPATVPNVFPHSSTVDDPSGNNVSGNQGSYHSVTVASTLAKDCTGDNQASFNVSITTPRLLTTVFPFKLLFKCS